MATFDVEKARNAGYSDQEIQKYMASKNLSPKFNVVGFGQNIGRSALQFGKDILSAPKNILNLGKGLVTGEAKVGDVVSNIGQSYKDRYGGWDELARTLYFDPVSVASDVSMLAGAGAGGAKMLGMSDDIVRGLTSASKATDPLRVAGRATSVLTKPVRDLFSKQTMPGFLDDASSALAKKSLRPSPSQQRQFLEATGMDIGDYARDMGLQGGGSSALEKVNPLIKSLNKKYNALARSNKMIDPTSFLDDFRATAREIVKNDFSTEAQAVADNLLKRADLMETKIIDYMIKNNTDKVPINIITDTKASAFSKVPAGTMADPTKAHAGKLAGGIGIKHLEKLAPGSQKLGKAQQAAFAFRDIAKQQSGLGRGTQLINTVKPSGFGAVLGGTISGFPGAVIGSAMATAANNPKVLAGASKALHGASSIAKTAKLPTQFGKMGNIANKAYQVSKYSLPITNSQIKKAPQPKLQSLRQSTNSYTKTLAPREQIVNQGLPTANRFYEEVRKKRGF